VKLYNGGADVDADDDDDDDDDCFRLQQVDFYQLQQLH